MRGEDTRQHGTAMGAGFAARERVFLLESELGRSDVKRVKLNLGGTNRHMAAMTREQRRVRASKVVEKACSDTRFGELGRVVTCCLGSVGV